MVISVGAETEFSGFDAAFFNKGIRYSNHMNNQNLFLFKEFKFGIKFKRSRIIEIFFLNDLNKVFFFSK